VDKEHGHEHGQGHGCSHGHESYRFIASKNNKINFFDFRSFKVFLT
jgi:hypothetical protein